MVGGAQAQAQGGRGGRAGLCYCSVCSCVQLSKLSRFAANDVTGGLVQRLGRTLSNASRSLFRVQTPHSTVDP